MKWTLEKQKSFSRLLVGSFCVRKYRKFHAEDRWKIIEDVVKGKQSVDSASKASSISKTILKEWIRKYG